MIFKVNTVSTYNVFEAARRLKIRNVVWASSETLLGVPFDSAAALCPGRRGIPGRPESAYSLSKLMGEEMAKQFCRWDPELKMIGLRFSNVMEPADYKRFPSFDAGARLRNFNLWGYIDARDAAQAIRLALEADIKGAENFIIANAETVMSRPNAELMAEVYPGVADQGWHRPERNAAVDRKARLMLGYEPKYSWREAFEREC